MKTEKRSILLLHGALGSSQDLAPLKTLLEEQGLEVLTFNFSGHGLTSPEISEFRIDFFARELDEYLQKNDLHDVAIFGHSMGGYVALYHKAHFENSPINRIFTYGTKFNWTAQAVSKEIPMLHPEHVMEKFPHFAEILKERHGERWKQLLRSTAHMIQNLERLDGLTKEDVAEIKIPVYLILGDQDRMVTSEETHLTSSWLSHSQVLTISHSKHELERSNLKEIAQTIEKNLDQ